MSIHSSPYFSRRWNDCWALVRYIILQDQAKLSENISENTVNRIFTWLAHSVASFAKFNYMVV